MKIVLVYTSTAPELIELVEKEVGDVPPRETEVASYQDLSILAETRNVGYVTAPLVARLVGVYMTAVPEGADVILNLCSSVGEVTDAAQDIARYTGTPIVCMDEEMCREVVRQGRRIGVMATLPTTLSPAKNTTLRVVRKMSHQVRLVDALTDDGLDLDREQFRDSMSEYAGTVADKMDVVLLIQDSMVYCEEHIHEKYGKVVLSSPRPGATTLKDTLVKKGLI